jgi:hypothetical protein
LAICDTDPAIESYRAVQAFQRMIDLVPRMSEIVARAVMVRQCGFALNRLKRRAEAEAVLLEVIQEQGLSSETNGLLGGVYKDRWQDG